MIIVKIIGGLGNQMFQYAFGYAMASKLKTELKLDITNFENYSLRKYELGLYDLKDNFASKDEIEYIKYQHENFLQKLGRKLLKKPKKLSSNYYKEKTFSHDENANSLKGDLYLDGYWQSQKYFEHYSDTLLNIFQIRNPLHKITREYEIKIKKTYSVSIHVRRGDYVANPRTNNVHGTCSLDYYKNTISMIMAKIHKPKFFIFSDDLLWTKENFNFLSGKEFIETHKEVPDHEQIYLMSQCKHNIIANSSFSWWGAWLNQNPNKIVIAPKRWFNDPSIDTSDLIPKSWFRI
jgi:hypothetical protein